MLTGTAVAMAAGSNLEQMRSRQGREDEEFSLVPEDSAAFPQALLTL